MDWRRHRLTWAAGTRRHARIRGLTGALQRLPLPQTAACFFKRLTEGEALLRGTCAHKKGEERSLPMGKVAWRLFLRLLSLPSIVYVQLYP
jgi:hypothetical protein